MAASDIEILYDDAAALQKKASEAGVRCAVLNYPWLNIADNHGFIEIAASGRMKKNFYTSEKTVQAQLGCYEQALADIICYMREIV